jgi:hypothetical protein
MDIPVPQLTDAQPILHPYAGSVWRRSNDVRDAIYDQMQEIALSCGLKVLVNRSPDFVYPNWVSMVAWLPTEAAEITRRVSLVLELHIVPYHRFEITYLMRVMKNEKPKVMKFMTSVDEAFLRRWMLYLLKDGRRPAWRHRKIRAWPLAVWMPANTLQPVRKIVFRAELFGAMAFLFGLLLLVETIPFDNPISDQIISLIPVAGPISGILTSVCGLGLVVAGVVLLLIGMRRTIYHMSSARPDGQPRQLRTADTWSTLLPRIGQADDEARQRFLGALQMTAGDRRQIGEELIAYITPDGKRERRQIVLSEGRAIMFCHIYAYADDLLIGWDAHLNVGQWTEKKLAEGIHRASGKTVVLNTVVPASARLNEYDLIDLNGLIDWAHTNLVRIVKALMSEHRLDEEIDFKIIRGERQTLLGARSEQSSKKSRFRRAE